jgi:hypothetical protein
MSPLEHQKQAPLVQAEGRVSVQLHPVSPWNWWRQTPPASKGGRLNQPPQELHLGGDYEIPHAVRTTLAEEGEIAAIRELRHLAPGRLNLAATKRMVDALDH